MSLSNKPRAKKLRLYDEWILGTVALYLEHESTFTTSHKMNLKKDKRVNQCIDGRIIHIGGDPAWPWGPHYPGRDVLGTGPDRDGSDKCLEFYYDHNPFTFWYVFD